MTGDDEPVKEGIVVDDCKSIVFTDLDAIKQELAEGQKEIDEIGKRITQWDKEQGMMAARFPSGAEGHIHWLLARYTELLDDIHGEKCFTEDGADHGPELVARIRALGPDYVKCFLPAELWDDQFQD